MSSIVNVSNHRIAAVGGGGRSSVQAAATSTPALPSLVKRPPSRLAAPHRSSNARSTLPSPTLPQRRRASTQTLTRAPAAVPYSFEDWGPGDSSASSSAAACVKGGEFAAASTAAADSPLPPAELAARLAPLLIAAAQGESGSNSSSSSSIADDLEALLARELGAWATALVARRDSQPQPQLQPQPQAHNFGKSINLDLPAVAALAQALRQRPAEEGAGALARAPGAVADDLLRLDAAGVLRGTLALLNLAGGAAGVEAAATDAASTTAAGAPRRGATVWAMGLLKGVAPRLGLLEAGIVLAAVYARFDRRADIAGSAAAALLPGSKERVRALLLHWALLPHLAAAGLPALPVSVLAELTLAAAATGRGAAAAGLEQQAPRAMPGGPPVSSLLMAEALTGDARPLLLPPPPPPHAPLFLNLAPAPPADLAAMLLACAGAARGAPSGGDAHAVGAVADALVRGVQPLGPGTLLVASHLAKAAAAAAAASITAKGGRQQSAAVAAARAALPLRLLLRAWAEAGGDAAAFDGALLGRALWQVNYYYVNNNGSADGEGVAATREAFADAAASVLATLTPKGLEAEASSMANICAAAGGGTDELGARALARAAERCDEPQARALLRAAGVPLHFWHQVWLTLLDPLPGTFAPSPAVLGVMLAEVPVTAPPLEGAQVSSGGGGGGAAAVAAADKLERAWGDVLALHGADGARDALVAALRALAPPAGARHVAALARAAQPQALAAIAGGALAALEREALHAALAASDGNSPKSSSAGGVWAALIADLSAARASLAASPLAARALCATAALLPADELPSFLGASGSALAAIAASGTQQQQEKGAAAGAGAATLELLYSCMAARRDTAGLQVALRYSLPALPPEHAAAALTALSHRMAPAAAAAARAAAAGEVNGGSSARSNGNVLTFPAARDGAAATSANANPELLLLLVGDPSAEPCDVALGASAAAAPAAAEAAAAAAARMAVRMLAADADEGGLHAGFSGGRRLAPAARDLVPSIARGFASAGGGAAAAFGAAAAQALAQLPIERAALGLGLLAPSLAVNGALRAAAAAVGRTHGHSETRAALEAAWFEAALEGGGSGDSALLGGVALPAALHDALLALEASSCRA